MTELSNLLAIMSGRPTLHVNGDSHPTALLTVDFGQPLTRPEMSSEGFDALTKAMRSAAIEMTRRRGEVRVQADNHRGVYWVAISNHQ